MADDLGKSLVAALLQFLAFKYQDPIVKHGTEIQLGGSDTKEVKLLLHKFLHHKGLTDYGVLNHSGVLEIVHAKPDEPKANQARDAQPYNALLATLQRPPRRTLRYDRMVR